jgi:hypothetical protein
MDVSLAKQYVRLAADLYFATVLRIKQDSISDLNRADVCSSCDHSCHASRRPICAVAGITMPAVERRSPASASIATRIRSCSIRIGNFSRSCLASPTTTSVQTAAGC